MRSMRRLGKAAAFALGAVLVLGGVQASGADEGYDELAQFPGQGLPDVKGTGVAGAWVTPQQVGLTYLKRAQQWTRTPTLQAVAFHRQTQQLSDPTCRRISQAPGASAFREWRGDVVLTDRGTALDSPRRYGYTQSFVVRTVAFGTVPVEATVALEQPRNARGVVIPATAKQGNAVYCAGMGGFEIPVPVVTPETPTNRVGRYMPAEVEGRLRLRVDQVMVDGVALTLTGCSTDDAKLSLTSRDLLRWDLRIPEEDLPFGGVIDGTISTTPYFILGTGGLLFGELDIPAFGGCVTAEGDDLSALLTASVSGTGNAVRIRTEGLGGQLGSEFGVCPFASDCGDKWSAPELPTAPPS